jgi:hypothetical protein
MPAAAACCETKRHALATRMVGRADDYPRFAPDLRIPSSNNEAEQVTRMSKLDQSLQLHALRPLAEVFCAIRSYLATACRHG